MNIVLEFFYYNYRNESNIMRSIVKNIYNNYIKII